jgi:hypothetical protein
LFFWIKFFLLLINEIEFNKGDLIMFGGEKYAAPMIALGPFVMNTELEISQAY